MIQPNPDRCGKCQAELDSSRRVDFTLKDGTRVCDGCFVKGTSRPTQYGAVPTAWNERWQ